MRVACLLVIWVSSWGISAGEDRSLEMTKDVIRQRLETRYDGGELAGGLRFAPEAKLTRFDSPELAALVPKARFFTTTIRSPQFEYPSVPAVASFAPTKEDVQVATCLSPVFTSVDPAFLALFSGVSAKTAHEQRRLAVGIGRLLAACTERGGIRDVEVHDDLAAVQLWHGKRHWRDVEIRFGDHGAVEQITLEKPAR